MDNLNNNSNNNNSNNDNLNNNENNDNNENPNIRTFYFNPTQSNDDIVQQITSFINNISNINQINHENNINSLGENNNGLSGLGGLGSPDINQNIQMFFEIEFLMNPENVGDDDEASHFVNCNHINEILGNPIYIKKDDPILESDCSICMDNYKYKQYKRILPECKHTFHKKCIDNWFKKNSSCPVCRKDFLTVQNNVS
jgi:hypothetical protein